MDGGIGFCFDSHWLKNCRGSFKPITKRSNRNHVITFDSHLKTALTSIRLGSAGSHLLYNLVSFVSNHPVASYHLGRSRKGSSGSCGASGGGCGSRHSRRRRSQSRRRRTQSRRRRSQSPSSSKVKPRLSKPRSSRFLDYPHFLSSPNLVMNIY